MSNYSGVATLRDVTLTRDNVGNFSETFTDTDVFVNVYEVGLSTWLAAKSAGLHADSEIQLRSLDYSGQQRVLMNGTWYEVERVNDTGEFTRLSLAKRLIDDPVPESTPEPEPTPEPTGNAEGGEQGSTEPTVESGDGE